MTAVVTQYRPKNLNFPIVQSTTNTMFVQKRDGRKEQVHFDKITERIRAQCTGLDPSVDATQIALKVIQNLHSGITTHELDVIAAKICDGYATVHPDYGMLAGRICISNLHKSTSPRFSKCVCKVQTANNTLADSVYAWIMENADTLDQMIQHDNDYHFGYFAFKTLENGYLQRIDGHTAERPQYMYMRVAIQINMPDLPSVKRCYKLMSAGYYTHGTPTLYNACTRHPQLGSCYLLTSDDSIEGIMKCATDCSLISKRAGGLGLHYSEIRAAGQPIHSTGGLASGVVPQLKILEQCMRTFNQGGKRMGALAVYMEPWHGDIMQFLQLKLQNGDETMRARDLFLAMWIPDLFMQRCAAGAEWSLFSEDTSPGLCEAYDGVEECAVCGKLRPETTDSVCVIESHQPHKWHRVDRFTQLYTRYEAEGRAIRRLKARDVLEAIFASQRESGVPYVCFKDRVNRRSNQAEAGTVRSSNLCVAPETMILTNRGQFPIGELENQPIRVWNGEQFSDTTVHKTGVDKVLIRVNLSNGVYIDCTPEHRFATSRGAVEASSLYPSDILVDYRLPVLDLDTRYPDRDMPINGSNSAKLEWLNRIRNEYGYIAVDSLESALKTRLLMQTMGMDTVIRKLHGEYYVEQRTGYIQVTSVENLGHVSDTYCFTEPLRGMGMFNGVLTFQCSEIMQVSSSESYACCTLASINLKRFLTTDEGGRYAFDFDRLHSTVRVVTRSLDRVVDINAYPVDECRKNAHSYRQIGIGIQGLADVFAMMRTPFLSPAAETLDIEITECIYHAALSESCALARELGAYDGWDRSPSAEGRLQQDLWVEDQQRINANNAGVSLSLPAPLRDWASLRSDIRMYGLRNSLVCAHMPTVSTSQILGNNESFEPFASNIYVKTTLGGKFTITNQHMVRHLLELGLWTDDMKSRIIAAGGSIQSIPEIPATVRNIYKTVWELPQKELMRRTALRSAYVDQGCSLNIYLGDNSDDKLRAVIFEGYRLGLKTGNYYIRSRAAAQAIKVDTSTKDAAVPDGESCPIGCTSCTS